MVELLLLQCVQVQLKILSKSMLNLRFVMNHHKKVLLIGLVFGAYGAEAGYPSAHSR